MVSVTRFSRIAWSLSIV